MQLNFNARSMINLHVTLSVIAVDELLTPRSPRALHVYEELASVFLTDANVSVPRYLTDVTLTDELKGLFNFVPFLNHSNSIGVAS